MLHQHNAAERDTKFGFVNCLSGLIIVFTPCSKIKSPPN